MEILKSPPNMLNCYLLKPIALHLHVNTLSKEFTCEPTCRFLSRGVDVTLPVITMSSGRRNTIRLGGIQTLPEDIKSFIVVLKLTDEAGKKLVTKTKIRIVRNLKMQAYLNLNQGSNNTHYVFIPEREWDDTLVV